MEQTFLTLNNGLKIPQFGMGVYMVPEGEQTKQACLSALGMGYRHIDTAHTYQNERSVGAAVRESGISREGSYQDVVDQGKREANSGFQPEIKPLPYSAADYDVIVIGTPTW